MNQDMTRAKNPRDPNYETSSEDVQMTGCVQRTNGRHATARAGVSGVDPQAGSGPFRILPSGPGIKSDPPPPLPNRRRRLSSCSRTGTGRMRVVRGTSI
jgi:hypothetical protein